MAGGARGAGVEGPAGNPDWLPPLWAQVGPRGRGHSQVTSEVAGRKDARGKAGAQAVG